MNIYQIKNIKGRQLFDIRNNTELKKNILIQYLEKWLLITKLMRKSYHVDIVNRQKLKFIGVGKILDELNKLSKRNELKNLKTKFLQYLSSTAKNKTLKSYITKKT